APNKNACPEEISWRVYVRRGNCGHDVGVVGNEFLAGLHAAEVPLDASGFRPMTFSSEKSGSGQRGIPVMTTTKRDFAFAMTGYVKANESKSSGLCHHCATWSCNAP